MSASITNTVYDTLNRHEAEIKEARELYHMMDKKVDKIASDVGTINQKIDNLINIEKRVSVLEGYHRQRESWSKIALVILNKAMQLWWLWIFIFLCILAFDVHFELKVENPQLASFITDSIKNKL